MGFAYGIGGLVATAPRPITGDGPPPASFKGILGQQYFDSSTTPPTEYVFNGQTWTTAGANPASTTVYGTVLLTDNSQPVATKLYADNLAIAGAPPATEITAGIAEIATQVETDAGVDDSRIVTPLKLANFVGAGGFPGSFTDLTATGTVSFTGATGGIVMTSATASSFGTTGAGIDLTLDSAGGRVVINGEEAAADAIRILSAAGGLDTNVALQMNLDSSQAAATAVRIVASNAAGGIDVDAGTGGIAIDTTGALSLDSAAASNFTVTGAFDLSLISSLGSVNISAGEAVADAINIDSSGGVDVDAVGQVNIASSQNAADSIVITSSAGGIDILASGATAGEDIDIIATGSSVNIESTEDAALAVYLHANGGTSETIRLRADQGTGAASIDVLSDVGGITLTAGLATADAINLVTSAAGGGIDIDSGTAGFIVDTTGAISLDSAAASNFTVTGAFDLTLNSSLGSVNISAGEAVADALNIDASAGGLDVNVALQMNLDSSQAAADAVRIIASGVAGGIDVDAGTGGITVDTTGALSLDSAAASNFTVTGAFDLTLNSTAGSVIVQGAEAAVDAVTINASNAAGGIDINAGTGGITVDTTGALSIDSAGTTNLTTTGAFDLTVQSTAGSVIISASESAVDALQLLSTAGGIDILASGAAAGEDIDIIATGSSVNITSTENVTDAIVINASGAASALQLDAGTGSIRLGSGLVVPSTAVNNAATPYTVLGTDYFIAVDTSAGVVTVTLPAATALAGRTYVIRDVGGAAAVNNITIGGGGTNLVGGGAAAASKVLSAAYSGATVISDGTVWSYAYVA